MNYLPNQTLPLCASLHRKCILVYGSYRAFSKYGLKSPTPRRGHTISNQIRIHALLVHLEVNFDRRRFKDWLDESN